MTLEEFEATNAAKSASGMHLIKMYKSCTHWKNAKDVLPGIEKQFDELAKGNQKLAEKPKKK